MPAPLEVWQQLPDNQHAPLLAAAAACGLAHPNSSNKPNLNAIAKLRKQYDADLVAAALQLVEARTRATKKFPDHAAALLADVEGVEQASSILVAQHKAKRFAALTSHNTTTSPAEQPTVFDLCCGIGGDAMAFTDAGLNVTAIDADAARAFMAQHNANCASKCTDVETWLDGLGKTNAATSEIGTISGTGVPPVVGRDGQPTEINTRYHIDPARRTSAGRAWQLSDYTPGPAFLRKLVERIPTGAIKLGPGVNHSELADELTSHLPAYDLEFISERGRLVQAVLWTGELANPAASPSRHTATLLPTNATLTGQPGEPPIDDIESYLYTVDSAVERAQLLHVLCDQFKLHAIHPALGMLTSTELVTSPWLTAFEFVEELPWRLKKVQTWLRDHNAGIVEVKTRGKAVNPDQVQRQLRGQGSELFTVFVLRFDEQVCAIITKRVPDALQ